MTTNSRPLILVVNDDGINSNGIKFLSSVMREIGDVFVVAPDRNRSGNSHSMTLNQNIFIEKLNQNNEFMCSGTPVDCVKLAVNKILPRLPDLCVSGINHGSNHSINALYSGTLHGAMEATIQGVNSISFSHLSYLESTNLFMFKSFIYKICLDVLKNRFLNNITLNINIPDVDFKKIKGVKLCTQSKGRWTETFKISKKIDQKKYYNISGSFKHDTDDVNSDAWALENNFISLVPIAIDCSYKLCDNELKYLEYDF